LLISLVPQRFEDGGWAGVPRFDWELRRVLPGLVSFNTRWPSLLRLRWIARRHPEAIVITGSETSVLVPDALRTIVVHHGSAQTHFDRDPQWRDRQARRWCRDQRDMYRHPNRWYVAAARWTSEQFTAHYGVPPAPVIPHWVERFDRPVRPARDRRVVLGDFRTFNKGRDALPALTARLPEFQFRNLACTYATRHQAYADADGYLCLSLSEGGSYALSDAEATALPIVMTDVGNCFEYDQARVIRWQDRDDAAAVAAALRDALRGPRGPSFFESWTLERWGAAWRRQVEEVRAQAFRVPVLP
jgi:glycosyltransferase involved in cell wall biosynthesis